MEAYLRSLIDAAKSSLKDAINAVQGRLNVVAVERERLRDGRAELWFVVDHQDMRSTHWRLRRLYGARRMPQRDPSV